MHSATDKTGDHARKPTLQAAQSLAMLDRPFQSLSSQDDFTIAAIDDRSISLQISLQRARLALLVGIVTCLLVAITVPLACGVELERFTRNDLSISAQERLLDQYNSYSGNVASAIGRPLELFVALMAQVVVLWLMKDIVFSPKPSWRVKIAVLVLGASVGFLLTNGLNALNVQVRELPVKMVMMPNDLGIFSDTSSSSTIDPMHPVDPSLPESSVSNPPSNTIFRSFFEQRVPYKPLCAGGADTIESDAVSFGLRNQPWMRVFLIDTLQEASVQIDLLTNDTSEALSHFPVDASVAADLLLAGFNAAEEYSPTSPDLEIDIMSVEYPFDHTLKTQFVPTPSLAGLLPNAFNSSEDQKREWFLKHSIAFVHNLTTPEWRNASLTRWTMTLSRVNITQSVWVDAITFESEVVRMDVENIEINGSRYYLVDAYRTFRPDQRFPEAKIGAYAVCNDSGIEGMTTKSENQHYSDDSCGNTSASSIYMFSTGKYLKADAVNSTLYNKNGTEMPTDKFRKYYKDVRYVYSTTFSRISWRLQNLSQLYDTSCEDNEGDCMGLDADIDVFKQRVLVSGNQLPLNQVVPVKLNQYSQALEVVTVRRPTKVRSKNGNSTDDSEWLGDVLLGHNVRNLTDDLYFDFMPNVCRAASSRRVQNYANNHIYIESTLQATYTGATFLLFQNGVEHDFVYQSTASNRLLLHLDGNIQEMSLLLSMPWLNAALTLIGCVVLIVAVIVVLVSSRFAGSPSLEDPHQIARVMVDDTTFPSHLLKRRIIRNGVEGDADGFLINRLAVGPIVVDKEEWATERNVA